MRKFTYVKVYKNSIGKRCMVCKKSATVTALAALGNGLKLPVRYCKDCATDRGATK